MIAALANLLIAIGIVAILALLTIKVLVPSMRRYRDAEAQAMRHEAFLQEQQARERQLREEAERELEQELGTATIRQGEGDTGHHST
jgi:type II secretory pathway pseudopilin PulG